jgi:hypothetical protein
MSKVFWLEAFRLVLPLVPEALVFVAGLIVTTVLRRRLGAAGPIAIGGFTLLAVAGVGAVAWTLWVLSRYATPARPTEQGEWVRPAGLELTQAIQTPVYVALLFVYLVGLMFVTAAIFVARPSHVATVARSR